MGQERVLGIDTRRHLIHTGTLGKDGSLELRHAVIELDERELALLLDMEPSLAVGCHEQHLDTDLLGEDVAEVQHHLALHVILAGERVGSLGLRV